MTKWDLCKKNINHNEKLCVSYFSLYLKFLTKLHQFSNFVFLYIYKHESKNLPQMPQMPQMCPKHGNLRCQLSIVLSVDCPEICPKSKNMCPKHGNLRCRMKCAPRLPQKIKMCPKTAPRLPQRHILPWVRKFSVCSWWWLDIFLWILVKV